MKKVNLAQKFALFQEHWSPKLVGAFNGQEIKLAKLQGEFVWHAHEQEDELFLVVQGRLRLLFEDGEVELNPGEFCVVPKGVRHKPVAEEECQVVLIEPAGTVNTGDAGGERTVQPTWL